MRTLRLAWQCARSDKVRSVLSVLALTLGILGLVTVVAANAVLAGTVRQRALMTGGDVSTFRAVVTGATTLDDLERYEQLVQVRSGAAHVAHEVWLPDFEVREDGAKPVLVDARMVSERYPEIFPLVLDEGDWGFRLPTLAPRVLLNAAASRSLTDTSFTLRSADRSFRVQVGGSVSDGATTPRVYLPLTAESDIDIEDFDAYLVLSGPGLTKDNLQAASIELATLRSSLAFGQIERVDTVAQLEQELATTGQVLLTLGVLSVGSTLLGTVNLGLAASKTRSREFALRRVLGASRGQIAMVTLLESQIIALVAAIFAFGLSWTLFPLVVQSFRIPDGVAAPEFSPSIAALSFGISASSALLAGFVPALLSFRRDFSEVMRY